MCPDEASVALIASRDGCWTESDDLAGVGVMADASLLPVGGRDMALKAYKLCNSLSAV